MRGTVAPPGSETSSSRQGSCRNLGDLMLPAVATAIPGHDRKSYGRRCRGRYEESDGCIVPMKPRTTPADKSGAESVEGRRPVEGRARANACPGHRAGTGMSPTACTHGPVLDGPPKPRTPVASDLRQEPGAGKPHAGTARGDASNGVPYRDDRGLAFASRIARPQHSLSKIQRIRSSHQDILHNGAILSTAERHVHSSH